MKRHSGRGLGGLVALIIAFFVGIVSPFLVSNEVGDLYAASGREKPVSAATGLWYFPGMFILIGPFIWFIKTNGALNDYWKSQGRPPESGAVHAASAVGLASRRPSGITAPQTKQTP